MKSFIASLLGAIVLVASSPVSAQFIRTQPAQETLSESDCRAIAGMVRYVAVLRDAGYSREALEAQVRASDSPADEIYAGLKAIETVYVAGSRSTAMQLYDAVYSHCVRKTSPGFL